MYNPPSDLAALLQNFGRPTALLIGDFMLDQYIYGDAERLSPEAPVPVVLERRREQRAGGAGNVAANLAVLGANVLCVGIRGDDANGRTMIDLLNIFGVVTAGIFPLDRPTSCKTRLVGLAQHRHPQQMLRLDNEDTRPISPAEESQLLEYIKAQLPDCHVVCIEDYNKGLLTADCSQKIIALARHHHKPVLVDPAPIQNYAKYHGAAAITPNRTEAQRATGLPLADSADSAPQLAAILQAQLDLEACVLTLDRHGIYLLERGSPGALHPTKQRTVYDVTGAGDMVLATLAMSRACGATWSQAVDLANIAGGLEVERFGCVPIPKEEILAEILQHDMDARGKTRTLPELLFDLQRRRKLGRKIVFTNGVFDILHAGHVQYLQAARREGDLLVVGVNSDASVQRLKGPGRPINSLDDRLAVLAALAAVDFVTAFDTDTPADLIAAIQPDVLVKGADYQNKEIVGREIVESRGGHVVLAPLLPGRSSSNIISKSAAEMHQNGL